MATYDDPYNPIPRRLRDPTPGYSQTRLPGTERTVVETPRGGFSPDPAPDLSERDLTPENYAMPFSPTRSMRYGPGDECDLGAPVVDPRDPLAPSPATWSGVVPRGSGRAAYSTNGGYAYTDAPAVPDQSTPRPLFSGVAGEDFEATRRRGEQVARLMRETDGPFANPNDWNYVRSYGPRAAAQAVASGRANISGADPALVAQERERFLRNRTTDLSISPQLRSAARDELAQIERDAAEERRREMWAAEQAGLAERARIAASVPVVGPGGVAAIPNADGGWDVSRPEPAPAAPPAPVSFGGGAGAIPEVGEDGQPTGRYVYQSPPTPSADTDRPVALGGGGMGVKDPATGEWTIKIPPKKDEKGARAVTLKPGESYYDPETKETYVAPGADRQSIEAEIANLTAALGKAFEQNAIAAIERQLADARARLAALAAPAPAAAAPAEAQPAPASAPAATASAQPDPAPAAPASAPASPTGHRRWTPGS